MAISISFYNPSFILIISVSLLFFFVSPPSVTSNRCLPNEPQALLRYKAAFNDSAAATPDHAFGYLRSWVNGTDCCTSWTGIACDSHTNHVISVVLYGVISESLCQLPFLISLSIHGASGTIPPCLGNLSHMQSLELYANRLSGMIPPSLCLLTRLTELYLFGNHFNGSMPPCLCLLTRLTLLDLHNNNLIGSIPSCLGNLSSLTWLDLSYNQLSGTIPDSLGNLSLLKELSIYNNQLSGTVPYSFSRLSSLAYLDAHGNRFNETFSSSLQLPPSLTDLSLSLDHHQVISDTVLHKLTSLHYLYLSDCVLNISTTWIPPFQLSHLYLVSCMIDSEFPPWISTQFGLQILELSNASLVGAIPSWLRETSPSLLSLNLSRNHLEGSLFPNISLWITLQELDVSRNRLSGHIPSMWSPYLIILLLNDNLFTANIPPSLGKLSILMWLNLENNKLTGVIPKSLSNCSSLVVLNLGNNNLEGSLPHEFGKLRARLVADHFQHLPGIGICYCLFRRILSLGVQYENGIGMC